MKKTVCLLLIFLLIINGFTLNICRADNRAAAELDLLLEGFGGGVSVYYENIETGYTYAYNQNATYFAASIIKAPYVLYTYLEAGSGRYDINLPCTYEKKFYRDGTGRIKSMETGSMFTLGQLCTYAIRYSDNIALAMLIDKLSVAGFAKAAEEWGADTSLIKTVHGADTNVCEAALYMKEIYRFIENDTQNGPIFKRDLMATSNPMIVSSYQIARKYGWSQNAYHDMAIVYAPSPYILVILSDRGDETAADREMFRQISLAVEALNDEAQAKEGAVDANTISVTISFAGDCTLGYDTARGFTNSLMDIFDKEGQRYGYFLENVKDIFALSDLAVVNLEGPLTTAVNRAQKEFVFKGPPEFANILVDGGVDAVNLANNHTMDYHERGYKDTIDALNGAGIGFFGAESGFITEINGVNAGFLGYKGWSAGIKSAITNDINALREQGADIVCVSFHWGDEGVNFPNNTQKQLGRHTIDAGADLVIGHHPHVIQGIENYNGKYIVYSLGNFCFGGNKNPNDKDTFIFQQSFEFTFSKDGKAVYTDGSAKIYPCLISSEKTRNNYQPTPAVGTDLERIKERLHKYSEPFKTDLSGMWGD